MKQPLRSHASHGVSGAGAGAGIMAILVLACAARFFPTFLSAWILLGSFLAVALIEGLAAFIPFRRKQRRNQNPASNPKSPWHPS